jgi:hypothetical protein
VCNNSKYLCYVSVKEYVGTEALSYVKFSNSAYHTKMSVIHDV